MREKLLMKLARVLIAALCLTFGLVSAPSVAAGDAAKLQVGVNVHALWEEYGDILENDKRLANVLDKLDAAKAQWVKIDLSWQSVEYAHNDDEHDWYDAKFRKALRMADARGFKILVTLHCTPAWAFGRSIGDWNNNRACNLPPPDPMMLSDFISDYITDRRDGSTFVKSVVDAWEIYNEPDLKTSSGFAEGDGFTPARYAALVRAAYRELDPEGETVVAGASVSLKALMQDGKPVRWNSRAWLNNIFDPNGDGNPGDGIKGHFHVLSAHPYMGPIDLPPSFPDRDWTGDGVGDNMYVINHVPVVKALMKYWGEGDEPIWFTEFGWSTHPDTYNEPGNWLCGVTPLQQAAFLTNALTLIDAKFPFVPVVFWYNEVNIHHTHAEGNIYEEAQWDHLGLLREDLSTKPAYWALKAWRTQQMSGADAASAATADDPSTGQTHLEFNISSADPVRRDDLCRHVAYFTVTMSGRSDQVQRVWYKTTGGTAEGTSVGVPPADYATRATELVFMPGETKKVVEVSILPETDCGDNCGYETFYVQLYKASQGIGDGSATGTITT